ncbi:MAG: bacillithiol biosynthesis BshC [Candidatus Thorarchaeota archaeon]
MAESIAGLYQSYIWRGEHAELARYLYDDPPITIDAVPREAEQVLEAYGQQGTLDESRISQLQSVLLRLSQRIGILTPRVRVSINNMGSGVVEAAHQTVCMGGPVFMLNKAATARRVADFANGQMAPVFFVADYDVVQPELINVRTPGPDSEGNLISIPVPRGYEHSPAGTLPLPDAEWYVQVEHSVRHSYSTLFKTLEPKTRVLFQERLESALALVRASYFESSTLGDWHQRIMGSLYNIIGDLGIPLIPYSDPDVRRLMQDGMEFLLTETNRVRFINESNRALRAIESAGYRAGLPQRTDDYSPFFLECPERDCHRSRVQIRKGNSQGKGILTGACPVCGQTISIEYDERQPDLSDYVLMLTPRVDTRQILVDFMLPVVCHIGGPGEISYYAQVLPCIRELGLPVPRVLRYPRVYFNTPWSQSSAQRLNEAGLPVLQTTDLFKIIGRQVRARKAGNVDEINLCLQETEQLIMSRWTELRSSLDAGLGEMSDDGRRGLRLDALNYLSWTYGSYAREKIGQEASWSWVEWMINTGVHDVFGPYERNYVPGMKNGPTLFVNFMP